MSMTQKQQLVVTLAGALLVGGGLGAYAYLGVFEAEKAEQARQEADAKLVPLDRDALSKLTVEAKGETTVLEKREGSWRITAPVDAAADAGAVDGLLVRLADASRKKSVGSKDPKGYGLETPAVRVTAESLGGTKVVLAFGDRNEFDGTIFARADEGEVVTVDAGLKSALEKRTFDLRDKKPLVFADDALVALEVQTGKSSYTVTKDGEAWKVGTERADEETVDGIVRRLHDLRATDFPATEVAFDAPKATVTLRRKEAAPVVVRLAEKDGKTFVRVDEGPVAEVAASTLESLEVSDLRDRKLFSFERSAVTRMQVAGEQGTFTVAQAGEGWELVEPKQAKARKWKVDSALSTLHGLRVDELVDGQDLAALGLDQPRRTITLLDAGGKELARLLVGKEEGADTFVQAEGGRIGKLATTRLSVIPSSADEVEEKAAETARTDD